MKDETSYPKTSVQKASAGMGLFAQEYIPKDQCIIEYTGERITQEEADRRGGKYLFEVIDSLVIDGTDKKHTARYLNHSCKPNAEAEHDEEEDRIYIRAIQPIHAGEEITFHYGEVYVKEIIQAEGCQCIECQKKG